MKLQEITANIRLRSPWEAIDMGFAMVQTWWKAIYIPLAILTFTLATILYFIIPEGEFWLTAFIFWWLKPLYDRLVLHIISHKLFNEELTSWQALKAIPSLIWNTGFFQTITFRRFSLSRGFNLPIWQLEKIRGKQRAERQRVLHLAAHSQAVWLTIAMVHIEIFFMFSLFALIALFLPENMLSDYFDAIFNKNIEYKRWIDYLNYVFYVLIVTLLHPFFIAGSFALYINRRTQLEAWDLELDFRKLAIRIKNVLKPNDIPAPLVFYLFLSIAIVGGTPSTVFAKGTDEITRADISNVKTINSTTSSTTRINKIEFLANTRQPAESSKSVIKEVMLTDNLDDKKTVKRWVKKKKPKNKNIKDIDSSFIDFIENILKPIALFISTVIEFSLWILIAIALILLFYYRDHWLYLFQGGRKTKDHYEAPEVMFGMDIRAKSLPDDIIGEAQKLWQAGQHREALSLLYRGALIRLINQEKVKLEDSYTEGDVLRHANKQLTAGKQSYLKSLTTQWKLIAYAHRAPAESDMQQLFTHWKSDFAIITVKNTAKNPSNELEA